MNRYSRKRLLVSKDFHWIRSLRIRKFPLAPMWVLAPGSAHARTSAQPPIETSGNFSAHVSGRGGGKFFEKVSDQFSRHIRQF